MKYVKMLGLAAVAAMALMAFLGASSASATVLCSTTSTPCAKTAWAYPKNTVIVISLEKETPITIANTNGSIENTCTGASVEGNTENEGSEAEAVSVAISALTVTGCSSTTDVLELGKLQFHAIAGTDNGTLTGTGVRVAMNLAGVSCTYGAGAGTHLGTITGGPMATVDITHAILPKQGGSFLCPTDAVWDAKYTVTKPEPLYIESR